MYYGLTKKQFIKITIVVMIACVFCFSLLCELLIDEYKETKEVEHIMQLQQPIEIAYMNDVIDCYMYEYLMEYVHNNDSMTVKQVKELIDYLSNVDYFSEYEDEVSWTEHIDEIVVNGYWKPENRY
jgi:hypothetical protein